MDTVNNPFFDTLARGSGQCKNAQQHLASILQVARIHPNIKTPAQPLSTAFWANLSSSMAQRSEDPSIARLPQLFADQGIVLKTFQGGYPAME